MWATFGAVLALYLLLPTKNYYWDGVTFALHIEGASGVDPSLFHPSHLLYNIFGRLLYDGALLVGARGVRALEVLRIANSILSVASAVLLQRILMISLRSFYVSVSLALLLSFSAVWWKFSTDANSYVPSVFLLLLCFRFLLPTSRPRPVLVAVLHAAGMLFHQLAVFFYPVALFGLWQQASASRTDAPARKQAGVLLRYTAIIFLLTTGAYCYAFYLQRRSFEWQAFTRWVTYYSSDAAFSFNLWNNLFYSVRGHARLVLGGKLALLRQQGNPLVFALTAVLLFLIILLCWRLVRSREDVRTFLRTAFKIEEEFKPFLRLSLVWIAVYVTFLFFWLPHNTFYRLFYLPALLMLCGTLLVRHAAAANHKRGFRLGLLVAIIAISNFIFNIFPYSRIETNEPLHLALEMQRVWPPGVVIYYETSTTDNELFRYFNPSAVWKPFPTGEFSFANDELRDVYSRGGSVWLETTAIDSLQNVPGGARWLADHAANQPRYELVDARYRIRYVKIAPEEPR